MWWRPWPPPHSAIRKRPKLRYSSSSSGRCWSTPAQPGVVTCPHSHGGAPAHPECSHSHCERLRSIQTHPAPLRGVQGAPLEGAHRREVMQFFVGAANDEHPCSHLHNPIVTSRSLRTTPASSFTALNSSIPRTQLGCNHKLLDPPELSVQVLGVRTAELSSGGAPPPPSDLWGRAPPAQAHRVHLARFRCGHHPTIPASWDGASPVWGVPQPGGAQECSKHFIC